MAGAEKATEPLVGRPGDYWRVPSVAREYERRRFHNLKGRLYRWREESAIRQALRTLPPGSAILDAACGTGRVTALLRRKGFRATGCDISSAMIEVARHELTLLGYDVPLVTTDVQHLPYQDKSFDAATCIGLLMHVGADARVGILRELARVTRDRLVVQYGSAHALNRGRGRISGQPSVRYPVSEAEMRVDVERSGLTERARFWVLRGFSSSVVVLLTKRDAPRIRREAR